MFIPDPRFPNPGSMVKNIPDIRIKEFKYFIFNPKFVSKLLKLWSGMFIPDLRSGSWFFLPIPARIQGSKGTGSGSAILRNSGVFFNVPLHSVANHSWDSKQDIWHPPFLRHGVAVCPSRKESQRSSSSRIFTISTPPSRPGSQRFHFLVAEIILRKSKWKSDTLEWMSLFLQVWYGTTYIQAKTMATFDDLIYKSIDESPTCSCIFHQSLSFSTFFKNSPFL